MQFRLALYLFIYKLCSGIFSSKPNLIITTLEMNCSTLFKIVIFSHL